MNAVISETINAAILGLGMQILEIPAQRKFDPSVCHGHFHAHKPPRTVVPIVLIATKILTEMFLSIPID